MTGPLPMLAALLLTGCDLPLPESAERNCAERMPFYPDEDGDGLGEPTDMFIGCEAPDGWVSTLGTPTPTGDTGTTVVESGDTAPPTAETGDTADTADATDTADTGT